MVTSSKAGIHCMRHEANTLTSHRLEHSFNDKRIEGERIGYRPSALR